MKILSPEQIYKADKATILEKGITSTDLMEDAAFQCFNYIKKNFQIDKHLFKVFCGVGNNGGDGLVIARYLSEILAGVDLYIVHFSTKQSDDFKINLERLKLLNIKVIDIYKEQDFPKLSANDIVIDAIFGVGLSKSPYGFTKKIIQHINNSNAYVLSIDLPSGMFANKAIEDKNSIVKATKILTFQCPKLAFLLPDNKEFCADFEVIEIGLSKDYINSLAADYFFTTQLDIQKRVKPRNKFSHKGTFGHSLIVGGSYGKIGAIILASKAALKIGSGLVSSYIPKCGYVILQSAIPEVMVEVDNETELHHFNYKTAATVVGVGPGLGKHGKTIEGFFNFLKLQQKPMVMDADAINILAENGDYLQTIPKNSVITPHPKEFERLVGAWENDFEKLEKLKRFSEKYQLIVVLKGAYTMVAHQNKLHFNSSGNAALATAGSGDVLTGMITGLIAQGYTPFDASILGVYLHGLTADIYTRDKPQETFIASDIIKLLPNAIKETFYP